MSILLPLIAVAAAILSGDQEEDEGSVLAHRLGVEYDPEQPFRIGPVVFGQRGIGAVSINRNVNYLGFVAWMTPDEYLALNEPLRGKDKNYDWIMQQVREGRAIAPPWLDANIVHARWESDQGLRSEGGPVRFQIVGHEGRHRMTVVRELCGPDVLVPVPVFVPSWRARHFTPHMLLGALMERDYSAPDGQNFVVRRLTLDRKNYALEGPPPPTAGLVAPVRNIDTVYHIGSMDPKDKYNRGRSLEGHTLSVTDEDHIDDWRRIAKLGGWPLWELHNNDGGRFLDRHQLDDADIAAWGEENSLLEPMTLYRVTSWDSEEEEEVSSIHHYPEDAEEEAEFNEGTVEPFDGHIATRTLDRLIGETVELALALDMAALAWAKKLGLDGVWWQDDEGEWSAPRGGILPGKLNRWNKKKISSP